MGYSVVAVEPMAEFLIAAQSIQWIQDCLPQLAELGTNDERFDLILVEAVWHHLNPSERIQALERLGSLLASEGRLAMSLRNGPAGRGIYVFPTDPQSTIEHAGELGMWFGPASCSNKHEPHVLA